MAKLGPDHSNTLATRSNLASAYRDVGRLALAIAMLEETLRQRAAKLGPDHPGTLSTRNNLAEAYQDAGRTADAIAIRESMLAATRKAFGPGHRNTLSVMNGLARSYESAGAGRGPPAAPRRGLAAPESLAREPRPGQRPHVARVEPAGPGEVDRGRGGLREGLGISEARQPDDWTMFEARGRLGRSLLGQRNSPRPSR